MMIAGATNGTSRDTPNNPHQLIDSNSGIDETGSFQEISSNGLPKELLLLLTASLSKFGLALTSSTFIPSPDPSCSSNSSNKDDIQNDTKLLFERIQTLGRQLGYLEIQSSGFRVGGIKRKRQSTNGEHSNKMQHYDMSKSEMESTIEAFIQAKRSKIDTSNQAEFTQIANEDACARTDAKEINRSIQMKLAVVENPDDPLARSWRHNHSSNSLATNIPDAHNASSNVLQKSSSTPVVAERLLNLESYLDIATTNNIPTNTTAITQTKRSANTNTTGSNAFTKTNNMMIKDVLKRINAVEDRIMTLERDYPVWSMKNLNQKARSENAKSNGSITTALDTSSQQSKPQLVGTPSNSDDDGSCSGVDLDAIEKKIQDMKKKVMRNIDVSL